MEYILLLAVVAGTFFIFKKFFLDAKVSDVAQGPLKKEFARTYQYGSPKVKGFDEGGPENHPQAVTADGKNFRIFINPAEIKK